MFWRRAARPRPGGAGPRNSDMKAKEYPFESVRISCTKCGRQGQYSRAAFVELVGAEMELPDALARISADCPKRQTSALAYDQCMAFYPDLLAA